MILCQDTISTKRHTCMVFTQLLFLLSLCEAFAVRSPPLFLFNSLDLLLYSWGGFPARTIVYFYLPSVLCFRYLQQIPKWAFLIQLSSSLWVEIWNIEFLLSSGLDLKWEQLIGDDTQRQRFSVFPDSPIPQHPPPYHPDSIPQHLPPYHLEGELNLNSRVPVVRSQTWDND